jgi:protein-S-isoprenylcysteine O-methyltransferase Ste14
MKGLSDALMYVFLIPLLSSFLFNLASTLTVVYSRRLGARSGQLISAILRDLLGLPLLGVAFALAAIQPVERLLQETGLLDGLGWLLIIIGVLQILWSLLVIRLKAAAPSTADGLVNTGPYAWVRHPLYVGVYFELAGASLVRPTWPILLSCLLSAGWLYAQAVLEEQDLRQRLPAYAGYMQRVPRFIPHFRKK